MSAVQKETWKILFTVLSVCRGRAPTRQENKQTFSLKKNDLLVKGELVATGSKQRVEAEGVLGGVGMERYLVDAPPAHNRGGEVLGDAAHRVSHLRTAITARISSGGGGAERALFHCLGEAGANKEGRKSFLPRRT
jgi:hypothetical protein